MLVVLNDKIHAARERDQDQHHQRARRSTARIAGRSALVHTRQDRLVRAACDKQHTSRVEFSIDRRSQGLPRVDIIYAHANMSADLIDAAVKAGAKGSSSPVWATAT